MAAGGNIDIVRGVDVSNQRVRYEIAQATRLYKPVVLLTGPPCTAFSGWSRLNAARDSPQHQRSLQNGILCSRFAAQLAAIQLEAGRHVIVENPRGSDLFKRPEWTALHHKHQLTTVTFPQC
eukprot:4265086-Amphidinium_carterae.1